MAKENQAVTADLSRLGAEKEDDRRRLGDALHKAATAEQVGDPLGSSGSHDGAQDVEFVGVTFIREHSLA